MKKPLTGLQKVCKMYGRMKAGNTMFVWDYANDEAVPESEMRPGTERWKASQKAKYERE